MEHFSQKLLNQFSEMDVTFDVSVNPQHAQIQKVLPEGVQLRERCFFARGERIKIALKAGHYQPASETPFKWCFAVGPMMVQN